MGSLQTDFEKVFYTCTGNLTLSGGVPWVENAFEGDTIFAQCYQDFRIAREHLCHRFHLDWEDADLELFMNSILRLEKDLAQRMFLYGIGYAARDFQL